MLNVEFVPMGAEEALPLTLMEMKELPFPGDCVAWPDGTQVRVIRRVYTLGSPVLDAMLFVRRVTLDDG